MLWFLGMGSGEMADLGVGRPMNASPAMVQVMAGMLRATTHCVRDSVTPSWSRRASMRTSSLGWATGLGRGLVSP